MQTLKSLCTNHPVLGIDLAGSEKKYSALAYLKDEEVATQRIKTNRELIDITLEHHARVVAIDSPLSLPRGRRSVYDSDPGRRGYGIERACEKELRRNKINVYPPLIPSMQELTKRGIELSEQLESEGFTVIETFPGGIQDILGIPRKKAGKEKLAQGLTAFGLNVPYSGSITHDELDAVTAALGAWFYLSGKYRIYGDDEEGVIVLPEITFGNSK